MAAQRGKNLKRDRTASLDGLKVSLADVAGLAPVVAALGTARFGDRLIEALQSFATIDQLAIVTYERSAGPRTLSVASRSDLALARSLTRDYVAKYHVADPILARLAKRRWSKSVEVIRHDPAQLTARAYEQRFFKSVGLVDKLALAWWSGITAYYANFYRFVATGRFQDRDVAVLGELADLIAALVRMHDGRHRLAEALRRDSALASAARLIALLSDRLTAREQQVLTALLMGTSSEGIGKALGVKPTSVATYRKRAYAKLGIATQAELFALCLQVLPQAGAAGGV